MWGRSRLVLFGSLATIAATTVLAGGGSARAAASRYMVVWAGDWNASDHSSGDTQAGSASLPAASADDAPGPDFLAVVDADPASPAYGAVVNTVTVPGLENEPHHMQYSWHPGDPVYAGGLFGDRTFVFNVDDIPNVTLSGVVEPLDTPCGSVPDAYWVLHDHTAFGTYMGGPDVAGDPRCNGGDNNGFAGTPGTIVRIDPSAHVIGEYSAAGDFNTPFPNDSARPARCASNPPLPRSSCANPHGIQAREDLHLMITSDYAEPRNVPTSPLDAVNPNFFRDTVRVWDIADLNRPRLRSVSAMPTGSMGFLPPPTVDARGVMGVMETTVTNLPQHQGAFASSMCGGQIWYTADITSANPMWRQVFDANNASAAIDPFFATNRIQGCVGAGWLQTSPDDTLLFQAAIGRKAGSLGPSDPGVPQMVYALDIRSLVAMPADEWTQTNSLVCTISSAQEVFEGGQEASCPHLTGAVRLADTTSGGPHWGAIDNFSLSDDPGRISSVTRIAASNYFVARAGIDGDHEVCMIGVSSSGSLALDASFRDERTGRPCVSFNRPHWPHGDFGDAKPHSMLFVTAGP